MPGSNNRLAIFFFWACPLDILDESIHIRHTCHISSCSSGALELGGFCVLRQVTKIYRRALPTHTNLVTFVLDESLKE